MSKDREIVVGVREQQSIKQPRYKDRGWILLGLLPPLYNAPLLMGHAALSSMHQLLGEKERGRKELERRGEGGAYGAYKREVTMARLM